MIELEALPFKETSWEPYISETTINFHYKKHHQAYVDKTNELIKGTEFENMLLPEIITASFEKSELQTLYNNAGQVYNHNIYWQSFGIWNHLEEAVKNEILKQFNGRESLIEHLTNEALNLFGSGWVWLVQNKEKYEILTTKNGDTPLPLDVKPLFNIDVWEHAYYIDYQNLRKKYAENFITNVLKI